MTHSRGQAETPQERLLTSGRKCAEAFPDGFSIQWPAARECRLQQRACDGFAPSSVFRGDAMI